MHAQRIYVRIYSPSLKGNNEVKKVFLTPFRTNEPTSGSKLPLNRDKLRGIFNQQHPGISLSSNKKYELIEILN